MIPLIHSHGLHRHGPAPPSPASSTGPDKVTRSEQVKAKSPPPTYEPSSPSLRRAPSMNSPVTRSNCRFHKISLPRGEDRERAYFVVPGCALGNGELMGGKDIRDEGFSTHEDHKRMLPNVETLDLDPYLVGVFAATGGLMICCASSKKYSTYQAKRRSPRSVAKRFYEEVLRQFFKRQSGFRRRPWARRGSYTSAILSFPGSWHTPISFWVSCERLCPGRERCSQQLRGQHSERPRH